MRILHKITWKKGEKIIACDFDHAGRPALLLHTTSGELKAELAGIAHVLPSRAAQASRIRWFGDSAALLWPIDVHVGKLPCIGKIDPMGVTALDLEYPLEVFSDLDIAAFIFSEERIGSYDKLASVFSISKHNEIARITDDNVFTIKGKNHTILEIEHAVLDTSSRRFWFSAYPSEFMWCFSFDDLRIQACELSCPRDEIKTIFCDKNKVSFVTNKKNSLKIYCYEYLNNNTIIFNSQFEILTKQGPWREVVETLDHPSLNLRGLAGNRIALITETSVLLFKV